MDTPDYLRLIAERLADAHARDDATEYIRLLKLGIEVLTEQAEKVEAHEVARQAARSTVPNDSQ